MSDPADPVVLDPAQRSIHPLRQISDTLPESITADLRPLRIALNLPPSVFPSRLGGFATPADSPYAGPKGAFRCALRGFGATADRIWFFRDERFLRYFERPERRDETTDLLPVAGNWNVPPEFARGVDATLTGAIPQFEGHVWLFSGDQNLRYDPNADRIIIPAQPIARNWNLPPEFASGFDAAVHGVGEYFGKAWFFKGSRYVRYDVRTDVTEFEAAIAERWKGWPDAFAGGIDYAFYGSGPNDGHRITFFRGDTYIGYDLVADRVDEGPARAVDGWPGLGRFLPVPQLFLDEQYRLSTFHGQIGNGGQVGGQSIPGRTKQTIWVITRRQESVSTASSSNVLESSSQTVADNFSDSLRRDQSDAKAREDYDYGTDASFHGEAQATSLTGGEVDAKLHVQGQTHDARSSFASAVGSQVERATQDSRERHSQQVRTEQTDQHIEQSKEVGFQQTVDNPGDRPLNFAVVQLTQEYILVLSLVGAQVVFSNGDPHRRRSVPATADGLAELYAAIDLAPAAQADVTRAVTAALSAVTDATTGHDRSLLRDGPLAVDHTVRTRFTVTDSTGAALRTIDVDGIVVAVERPVALTGNTAIVTLD
jgi:hypothetical protein